MAVRLATSEDLDAFDAIERSAGAPFALVGMPEISNAGAYPVSVLAEYVAGGRAWVEADGDQLRAYLLLDVLGTDAHIEQVSVDQRFRGLGLGRRLIDAAHTAASERAFRRLTLTTFSLVPWNKPYYERLGFVVEPEPQWSSELQDLVAREAAHGHDRWPRVVMARSLS